MKFKDSFFLWLSVFFFLSGFCSLLYQIVWLRLAFAHFGINTPVLSVVLSVFMAGLALGSWAGGRLADHFPPHRGSIPLRYYGAAELLTGFGALGVPLLFDQGTVLLLPLGNSDSSAYLLSTATVLLVSLLPWCFFMGTTFPFMTAFLKTVYGSEEGFSFLYNSNVLGALSGVLMTAVVLIECLGFRHTLLVGAGLNTLIGLASLGLSRNSPEPFPGARVQTSNFSPRPITEISLPCLPLLFTTGFVSMGLEVVWTRAYTYVLSTLVYTFAGLLFSYLLATFGGSSLYRRHLRQGNPFSTQTLLGAVFIFSFIPPLLNDARLPQNFLKPLISLIPLCAAWGYLTPKLIDQFSRGNPRILGKAYAANILGCIVGPLAASYFLLPAFSCRLCMIILSIPLGLFFLLSLQKRRGKRLLTAMGSGIVLVLFICALNTEDWEEKFNHTVPPSVIHRDYTATTVSSGSGMAKNLFVNGVGITGLFPPTKIMAHLPMGLLPRPARSVLDICFGMGTTFRSLMSWGVPTTAVELVPSVFKCFSFYYPDSKALLFDPHAHLVADDGRRFLQRTSETFDLITIDPPPPVEAAGSSLLYSTGFYDLAKKHLNPGGLLQQWLPGAENKIGQAVCRSLVLSFPYVRVFSYPNHLGYHFIASLSPIPSPTAQEMVQKMPLAARQDLEEWTPHQNLENVFQFLLACEIDPHSLLNPDPTLFISDDRPFNEYFLLRRIGAQAFR